MADNMDLKRNIELEEVVAEEEVEAEGITMELLREFKENNKRLISAIKTLSISFALAVVAIIVAIFIYLYQYDFESYSQDGSGYNERKEM